MNKFEAIEIKINYSLEDFLNHLEDNRKKTNTIERRNKKILQFYSISNCTIENKRFVTEILFYNTFLNVTFKNIDFRGTNFNKNKFFFCDFIDCDCTGAIFSKEFANCNFNNCILEHTAFDESNLYDTNFINCLNVDKALDRANIYKNTNFNGGLK
jgi:uncharacterized protein YjbI with pentapeptide repeats